MPDNALPPHLRGTRHWDWPFPFNKIPRAWTSFDWGAPRLVAGRSSSVPPKPVPKPGEWHVASFPSSPFRFIPIYIAVTLRTGRHYRFGARWDDVDDYTTFPTFATRKFRVDGEDEDTSTR